ncbi:MAG: hypothetical protein ACSLFI_10525 [Solirubrobacterales bacterium]
MEGLWPFLFLAVILKVPIVGMIYLLYWAARPPEVEAADDEGTDGHGRRRRNPPRLPRGPRRDPHGGGIRPVAEAPHEGRIRQLEAARARDRSREIVRK